MTWWQYLLLVNLYLILFYGFYALLLRRETFFHLNRIYLVSSALLSFFIPLIHSDWVKNLFITQQVQHTISVYGAPIMIYNFRQVQDRHVTTGQIILTFYAVGSVFLLMRFILQLMSLKRIINRSEKSSPFSFFRNIWLGNNPDSQEIIAAHEHAHASQWHSADILLIEMITIINWFNPILYFYRLGIKHIHEFIADRQALKSGMDKADYALLLLSQTVKAPAHQLVNPFFNHSLLKQRILMLHRNRSHRTALLKYGLSAPLFILMLVLSSVTISKSKTVKLINKKAEQIFLTSPTTVINSNSAPTAYPSHDKSIVKTPFDIQPNDDHRKQDNEPVFMAVEKEPEFKGGISEFYHFLGQNIKYPEDMLRKNIQGKVFISMTVERDGSLSDFKVEKDIGFGAAIETIRALKVSPKWQPGYQNGQAVRVRYTLPITFAISKVPKDTTSDIENTVNQPILADKVSYKTAKDTVRSSGTTLLGLDTRLRLMYIVDGKILNDLNSLNPENISSITLVKNAADLEPYISLFGSKAADGVVLIRTRSTAKK